MIRGGKSRPEIISRLEREPARLRALMESVTIDQLADMAGVTAFAVKRWEVEFSARCMRVCTDCGTAFRFVDMAADAGGSRRRCVPCKTAVLARAQMSDRELMAVEYDVPMSRWARVALPRRVDGINGWRYQQGGVSA